MRSLFTPAMAACLSTVLSTASANDPIVVSSKIDTEGSVLGELIIQTLERNGIPTEDRLQLVVAAWYAARCRRVRLICIPNTPATVLSSLT